MIKMRFRNIFILGVLFTCLLWLSSCQKTSQKPKNIIVMISDGCGYNQIEATSIYRYGGKNRQSFAAFPVKYGMSTYPAGGNYDPDSAWVDFDYARKRATDSAASATAIATGVKTNILALSVDTLGQQKHTILEKAELLGKSSGVVTSVPFAQATPAAFVAHNLSRFNYPEIAKDMINSQVDVIMGCGHPLYNNDGQTADSADYRNVGDEETWQLLVQGQMGNNADQDEQIEYWQLIQNRNEFQQMAEGSTPERVIGIPKVASTLQCARQMEKGIKTTDPYELPFTENVPTLSEMAATAINVLDNNPRGFFLMIEGGAVDWACHEHHAGRMIEEESDFIDAVDRVIAWVENNSSWDETLLVVTADHETGYLTGPESGPGDPPVWNPLINYGKGKLPGLQFNSKGHTNTPVPFFAKGAGSERFDALADQTDPVRGRYLDNAEVGQLMMQLFSE